ncbi:MAG: small multi-drug resistant family protein [Methylococcaceae bacterium]|nr:small multi-drug resistant family protein [Methylococcaceae bacterium]
MTISWPVLTLIFISVTISAVAQITLKHGMSTTAVQQSLSGGILAIAWAVAKSLYVWLGLMMYALGAVLWLGVLAKINVSIAYPFVGLGFILTALFGVFLLGEAFSVIRFVGTCLVVLGIILVTHQGC